MLCEFCEELQSNAAMWKQRSEHYRKLHLEHKKEQRNRAKKRRDVDADVLIHAQLQAQEQELELLRRELSTVRMLLDDTRIKLEVKMCEVESQRTMINKFEHVLNQLHTLSPEVRMHMMLVNASLEQVVLENGHAATLEDEMAQVNLALVRAQRAREQEKDKKTCI